MISAAQVIIERAKAGLPVLDEFSALPAWQMRIWWSELSSCCPSRMEPDLVRRPANALNIEIGAPQLRCSLQSPDGRGMAWVNSGGSILAYGCCSKRSCPMCGR